MEQESSSRYVLPHLVFGQTLVPPGVLLLKAGDLQHHVGVLHFHFAGEGDPIRPSPGDLRDWAATGTGSGH